jgi:hypothetical protein
VLGISCLAIPARGDTLTPAQRTALTTVSTPTMKDMRVAQARVARTQQSGPPSDPGFLKTRKGAVAVSLMAAGAVFTVWSINHDRKPVKSAIR